MSQTILGTLVDPYHSQRKALVEPSLTDAMRPSILLLTVKLNKLVKLNKETPRLVGIRPTLKLKFLHDAIRFILKPS